MRASIVLLASAHMALIAALAIRSPAEMLTSPAPDLKVGGVSSHHSWTPRNGGLMFGASLSTNSWWSRLPWLRWVLQGFL